MTAPFGKIDRARRQRLGMEGQPQDIEGLRRAAVAERPRATAPPCGWPSPDSSAGHRPAPDWVRAPSAPGRSPRAPISARDRRGRAAEKPARSRPPPARRCVRARAPPGVRPVSRPSRATARRGRFRRNSDAAPISRRHRRDRAGSDGGAAAIRANGRRYGRAGIVRLAPWKHVRSWWKTYHANFAASITSEVIELPRRPGHLRHHRR